MTTRTRRRAAARSRAESPQASATPTDPAGGAERGAWMLPIILLVAVLLRLAWLLQYRAVSPFWTTPVLDAAVYDAWARDIAAGTWQAKGPFYFAPGYAYALAFLYRYVSASVPAVYVAQMMLGLLAIVLVHRLAAVAFGRRAALLAAAVATLYAPLPFLELKLLSATLGVTLLLAALVGLAAAAARGSGWRWLAAGVVLGATSLVRAETLLAGPLVLGWIVARAVPARRAGWAASLAAVGAVSAGWALALAPVAIHNVRGGAGVGLVSSQAAITFYQSNNPRARGFYVYLLDQGFSGAPEAQEREETAIAERERGRTLTRAEVSAYWIGRALDFMRTEPGRFVWLLGQKVLKALSAYEYATEFSLAVEREAAWLLRLAFVPFTLLLALALPTLLGGGDRVVAPLLRLGVAANAVVLLLFYVASRYRLPAVPLLAVFAGATLDRLLSDVRLQPRRALATAAVVTLVVAVFSREWDSTGQHQEAAAHCGIGLAWAQSGQHARAVPELQRAVEIMPTRYDCWYKLGASLRALGQPRAAAAAFGEAVRVQPALFRVHVERGAALEEAGDLAGARAAYETARRLRPDDPAVAAALARLAARGGS